MTEYTRVYTTQIGSHEFFVVEWKTEDGNPGGISIRTGDIESIVLSAANGGCDNCVLVKTVDEDHYFAYHGADLIRQYLLDHHTSLTEFPDEEKVVLPPWS